MQTTCYGCRHRRCCCSFDLLIDTMGQLDCPSVPSDSIIILLMQSIGKKLPLFNKEKAFTNMATVTKYSKYLCYVLPSPSSSPPPQATIRLMIIMRLMAYIWQFAMLHLKKESVQPNNADNITICSTSSTERTCHYVIN